MSLKLLLKCATLVIIRMKSHILLIEDDRHLSESIADILSLDDYDVTVRHSGREGLATALAEHPDLIILDIKMPDMDGYGVFEALQMDDWGKKAKVLVLTASESLENIAKNIKLPREQILFKPEVSIEELRTKVAARLQS